MIQLEHVSKSFSEGIPALNDVSLHISEGEFVFVVGDSGSGKSTLIKLLLKELEPTSGSITINGKNLRRISHRGVPHFRRNLLADEPTGNLDNNNAWEIMNLLEMINSRGTTVVVVTHNMDIVQAMGKRVITIQKGTVISDSLSDGTGGDDHEN
jgi:ABC-type ATPase involved in cell division